MRHLVCSCRIQGAKGSGDERASCCGKGVARKSSKSGTKAHLGSLRHMHCSRPAIA